jgi:hypothetical protein
VSIHESLSPDIPFTNKLAERPKEDILREISIVALLKNSLRSDQAKSLFDPGFLKWIGQGISEEGPVGMKTSGGWKGIIKRHVPGAVKNWLLKSGTVKPGLDGNLLAFRVYIILRMHQILTEDCRRFGPF